MSLKESNSFDDKEDYVLGQLKTGYVISVCEETNDNYIVGVSHIEKNDSSNICGDDEEAQDLALRHGAVPLLSGFICIPDNVYLDTEENRRKLQSYFVENLVYEIIDKESLSALLSSAHKEFCTNNEHTSINKFGQYLDVSPAHLSRIIRELIDYTSSDVIMKLADKTELSHIELLSCLNPILENFME